MREDEKLAIAARYIAATTSGDIDTVVALTEPDAVSWHNHDDLEVDVETTRRTLSWLHRKVTDLAWEQVALLATSEGFLWRATMTGTAPGGPLRVHTCVVATVSPAGKVARIDEYLDPASLAPLTRP